MIILCSDKTEYGEYNPKDLQSIVDSFKSLDYEVSTHKIENTGKIFPRLPEDIEFAVGVGLNERKAPEIKAAFFSIYPMLVSNSNQYIDYRFVKDGNISILHNVNNLPLNANMACYCYKSMAYTIRKMVLDQWELTNARRT